MPAAVSEIAWFRYVPHGRVAAYLAIGWLVDDDLAGTSHGQYAVLMQWPNASDPIEPR